MSEINATTTAQLERIKKNIKISMRDFAKNADNFNKMKKFCFLNSLDDDDKQKLDKLKRPTLEFNIIESHISRLLGEFSIVNPQFKIQSTNPNAVNNATVDIVSSIVRKIMYDSQSESLDTEIYKDILGGGYSVMRVYTEYTGARTFDQDIKIGRVNDPTMCGFDPGSEKPHKGDGRYAFECYPITKDDFEAQFPDVEIKENNMSRAHDGIRWQWEDAQGNKFYMLCDYYEFEDKRVKLHLMGANEVLQITENQVMTDAELKAFEANIPANAPVQLPLVPKQSEWRVDTSVVRYRLFGGGFTENKKKTDFAYLPLIFVDCNSTTIKGKQTTRSYAQQAVGTQRAKNIMANMMLGEIQDVRRTRLSISQSALPENPVFLQAYINPQENYGAMVYKDFDLETGRQLGGPVILPSAPIPPELSAAFNNMDGTLQTILGSYTAQQGAMPSNISEETLLTGIGQSNAASKPPTINYTASTNQLIKVILDLIPKLYITPRTMPVIDASGNRTFSFVNDPKNKDSLLRYEPNCLDLYVTTGVSFSSQKDKALKLLSQLSQTNQGINKLLSTTGLPILLKNVDCKGSDELQTMAQEEIAAAKNAPPPPPPPEIAIAQKNLQLKENQMQLSHQQKMAQIEADREKTQSQQTVETMKMQLEMARMVNEREELEVELSISQDANAREGINQKIKLRDQAMRQMQMMIDTHVRMIEHHGKMLTPKLN